MTALTQLTNNCSKEAEYCFINQVVDTTPDGTYLKSFFTESLSEWIKYQIKMDLSLNIIGEMDYMHNLRTELDETIRRPQIVISLNANEREAEIDKMNDRLQYAATTNNIILKQIDELRAECSKKNGVIGDMYDANEQLEQQVMKLKVRLFDLMDAGTTK